MLLWFLQEQDILSTKIYIVILYKNSVKNIFHGVFFFSVIFSLILVPLIDYQRKYILPFKYTKRLWDFLIS